jgi:hypothetical protein
MYTLTSFHLHRRQHTLNLSDFPLYKDHFNKASQLPHTRDLKTRHWVTN